MLCLGGETWSLDAEEKCVDFRNRKLEKNNEMLLNS
jgi:hypothetical protein